MEKECIVLIVKQLILLALVLAASVAAKDKKPAPLPQIYPRERVISVSCDSTWTIALQTFVRDGWTLGQSDRPAGVLAFTWGRGGFTGNSRQINPSIAAATTEKTSSFVHQWSGFRVVSASVLLSTKGSECLCRVDVTYHGIEVGSGVGWKVLESNGHLESEMLNRIAATGAIEQVLEQDVSIR